jgi:hypothetical protein
MAGCYDVGFMKLLRQNVEIEQIIFSDEIHDFLLWRTWVKGYAAAAEFLDRKFKPRKMPDNKEPHESSADDESPGIGVKLIARCWRLGGSQEQRWTLDRGADLQTSQHPDDSGVRRYRLTLWVERMDRL